MVGPTSCLGWSIAAVGMLVLLLRGDLVGDLLQRPEAAGCPVRTCMVYGIEQMRIAADVGAFLPDHEQHNMRCWKWRSANLQADAALAWAFDVLKHHALPNLPQSI